MTTLECMRTWLREDLLNLSSAPELEALIDDLIAADARPVEMKGLEFMDRIQAALTRSFATGLGLDESDAMPAIVATVAISALYRATRNADGTPIEATRKRSRSSTAP